MKYFCALLLAVCICHGNIAAAVTAGSRMPAFTVYAGKSDVLESSSLQGKVIIITYETRESKDTNNDFKAKVSKYYFSAEGKQDILAIVPVINCFKYFWPVKRYCIKEVRKDSKKTTFKLYVDRYGDMSAAFGVQKQESNVFLVDKQGLVRFVKKGKLEDQECIEVLDLIKNLVNE